MYRYYLFDRVRDERLGMVVEMKFQVTEFGFATRSDCIAAAVSRAVEIGRISGYTPLFRAVEY